MWALCQCTLVVVESGALAQVNEGNTAQHASRALFSEAGSPPAPSAGAGFARNMSSSAIARTPPAPTRGFFAAVAAGGASAGLQHSGDAAVNTYHAMGQRRRHEPSQAAQQRWWTFVGVVS